MRADEPVARAVNFAILVAHRLGEPRVLELPPAQVRALRRASGPGDWGRRLTYRGLRVVETSAPAGRVLVWDRMRETEMIQPIAWPGGR
ncbi:MAG: hypothetical protein WCY15_02425 [Phenylobacterium sp.]|jgi:hypothetical protein|uniref:hypothetical protein n=1 Tax=Phenylobacterium sp. TaxID=1871053 RepID=UPI002A364B20|nr:hypothetical protein [Phenylobacterium sp.]MDX9996864.1 hypothetical protein [Phenylobacterium sp.]